jgi:hypothetical protein
MLGALINRAGDIATIEACNSVLSWLERSHRRDRITVTLEALCYADQDLIPTSVVAECLFKDAWWNDLETDLSRAQKAVADIERAEGTVDPSISDILSRMEQCIAAMRGFEKVIARASRVEIRNAYMTIDTLVRAIRDLITKKNVTRTSFLSEFASVQ